jgi:hypothetical protein
MMGDVDLRGGGTAVSRQLCTNLRGSEDLVFFLPFLLFFS